MTVRGLEAQTRHSYFAVWNGESAVLFFFATSELIAHLYVTSGLHLFVRYRCVRKKLSAKTFVTEKVEIPPIYDFVGLGNVQHAGIR